MGEATHVQHDAARNRTRGDRTGSSGDRAEGCGRPRGGVAHVVAHQSASPQSPQTRRGQGRGCEIGDGVKVAARAPRSLRGRERLRQPASAGCSARSRGRILRGLNTRAGAARGEESDVVQSATGKESGTECGNTPPQISYAAVPLRTHATPDPRAAASTAIATPSW